MNKEELKKELEIRGILINKGKIKKSDIDKRLNSLVASTDGIRYLMQALYQMLGNKRYLHDLETLLKDKLGDLKPEENETLMFLTRDLKQYTNEQESKLRKAKTHQQWNF